jgi:hypothetical protein
MICTVMYVKCCRHDNIARSIQWNIFQANPREHSKYSMKCNRFEMHEMTLANLKYVLFQDIFGG